VTAIFLGSDGRAGKDPRLPHRVSEIETVLSQHPAVRETVVIAHKNISDGKRLIAYVALNLQDPAREAITGRAGRAMADPLRPDLSPDCPGPNIQYRGLEQQLVSRSRQSKCASGSMTELSEF